VAADLDETDSAATPKTGFCSLGTMRKLATQKTSFRFGRGNRGPPNRAPELRGQQARLTAAPFRATIVA
jgi:hypothetical protein